MPICFDREGRQLDTDAWCKLMNDRDYSIVEQTMVGHFKVSTVWIGLDHSFGDGPPLIFETMVFDHSKKVPVLGRLIHPSVDGMQERYGTEAEAREGHANMLGHVRATLLS